MGKLDSTRAKRKKRKKKISAVITLIIGTYLNVYLTHITMKLLENKFSKIEVPKENIFALVEEISKHKIMSQLFLLYEVIVITYSLVILTKYIFKVQSTKTIIVAGKIEIPVSVGQGQFGTARFMKEKEVKEVFTLVKENEVSSNQNLGLVIGRLKNEILCVAEDINVILLGASRSGKGRRLLLETIWLRGKTDCSMVIPDPKGENYLYSKEYLEKKEFNIIVIDLIDYLKSSRFNYLQSVINAYKEGDIPKVVDYTWDIVSSLVEEPKGEKLWANGEAAVIATAILAVIFEAPEEFQNMANVYYFIGYMCEVDENDEMPLTRFMDSLRDDHPAKGVYLQAKISPEKMRGSFYGSALTTLRLFTNPNIAALTAESDFQLSDITNKKTAVFLIVPDEKDTMYSLVSLFINQAYVKLTEVARKNGNRLKRKVDFYLEELGNFPRIPNFGSMVSVGLGRGIRFVLVLQDYQQLEKHYKDDFKNIKGNCVLTVYLKTPTSETLEELSKRMGSYTVQSNNESASMSGKKGNESFSSSASLQKRSLLLPEEIAQIEQPYSLVLYTGKYPAILNTPDLVEYKANKDFGMGTQEENQELQIVRGGKRKSREETKIALWGIWKNYKEEAIPNIPQSKEEKYISFLNFEDPIVDEVE